MSNGCIRSRFEIRWLWNSHRPLHQLRGGCMCTTLSVNCPRARSTALHRWSWRQRPRKKARANFGDMFGAGWSRPDHRL